MIGYQVLACNKPGQEPPPKSYEYGFVSVLKPTQDGTRFPEYNLQGTELF